MDERQKDGGLIGTLAFILYNKDAARTEYFEARKRLGKLETFKLYGPPETPDENLVRLYDAVCGRPDEPPL